MAEEKKNAQVLNGINEDITELKSLSTVRKRVVSDGEIVSRSPNGFRLGGGNSGVILRNDGKGFYALITPDGQAQDNTTRRSLQDVFAALRAPPHSEIIVPRQGA